MTVLLFSKTFGQTNVDCFDKMKKLRLEEIKSLGDPTPKSEIAYNQSVIEINQKALNGLMYCKFPTTSLRTSLDKDINTSDINSEFVIINFNYHPFKASVQQLEDLAKIKAELKDKVTILVFFPQELKDIQQITEKYKSDFEFIPDAKKFIDDHNLDLGPPFNIILDKYKVVTYATYGVETVKGRLYAELVPYLK